MHSDQLVETAPQLIKLARSQSCFIATAESCTAGRIAASITEISGSSDVFDRGFVTYTNQSKSEMLDVPMPLINKLGAVSKEVAISMSEGALKHSNAQVSVAVTGIAGPSGGTATKPVGLVHIASAKQNAPTLHHEHHFKGSRHDVRVQTTQKALELVIKQLSDS